MIRIEDEVFNDGLPESISFDSQVQTIGDVSDIRSVALLPIVDQLRVLCNIPNLTEPILDLLAFQFSVLFYAGTYNITDPVARLAAKRQLIANNFYYHAHLGTPATMQDIVTAIFSAAYPTIPSIIVQEWFSYGGTANHYRILTPIVINGTIQGQITATQRQVKRASQAFDGYFLYNVAPDQVYIAVGAFTQIWQFTPIGVPNLKITFLSLGATVTAGATVQSASQRVLIASKGGMIATASQITALANVARLTPHASMTNTTRILRIVNALIRAGHG